ncbi:ATP-dependent helicase/deoxyribonuclease subunit B [Dorea longicatena]|nr:ATP-dependent helicase/deoxyribonuclease subunit B [Dorea longicatena]
MEFLDYTKKLEAKLKGKIADGEVQAEPYEMGGATGCDYCAYRAICGFDTRIEGYEYRRLEKYSKEDVLEKIHIAAQEER